MKPDKRTRRRSPVRAALVIWTAVTTTLPPALAQTHYVSNLGSFCPAPNDPGQPWIRAGGAACAINAGGVVQIAAGSYRESLRIDRPVTLTASGGMARIGAVPVQSSTTFNVIAFNTHLFGDVVGPSWQDYERAVDIADFFTTRHSEIDFVGMSEIWDEDLFLGGDGAEGIFPNTPYASGTIGTVIENQAEFCSPPTTTFLHSGLAMMSRQALTSVEQVAWDDCDGSCPWSDSPDCLANKGWLAATVVKDGFAVRIFLLHMQAGNNEDQVEARQVQINQLASAITAYRQANPTRVVLAIGDFNVVGQDGGQYGFFASVMHAHGGHDVTRHSTPVCFDPADPAPHNTNSRDNELALYFDPDVPDARLDYLVSFPSGDGTVRIVPDACMVLPIRGRMLSENGLSSDEKSDHYAVEAHFTVYRP